VYCIGEQGNFVGINKSRSKKKQRKKSHKRRNQSEEGKRFLEDRERQREREEKVVPSLSTSLFPSLLLLVHELREVEWS